MAYSEAAWAFWTHWSRFDTFIFLFHLNFISKTTFDTVGMIQAAWTLLLLSLRYWGEGGNDNWSSCPFNSRRVWICEFERGCSGNVFVQLLTANVYFLQTVYAVKAPRRAACGADWRLHFVSPQNKDFLLWPLIPAALISKFVGRRNFIVLSFVYWWAS